MLNLLRIFVLNLLKKCLKEKGPKTRGPFSTNTYAHTLRRNWLNQFNEQRCSTLSPITTTGILNLHGRQQILRLGVVHK